MSRPKPHQIPQFKQQRINIKHAGFMAWGSWEFYAESEGTFYSERFNKLNPYCITIQVPKETAEWLKTAWEPGTPTPPKGPEYFSINNGLFKL